MKNVYVLPTDKPSNYVTNYMEQTMQFHNIYITNDEKIKEGDWVYHKILKSVFKIDLKEVSQEYIEERKNILKIILSTDQDLIKDGVQAIDDEFLEWFVKNPSCERVEIGTYHVKGDISGKLHYKIIIPKEEHKQFKK